MAEPPSHEITPPGYPKSQLENATQIEDRDHIAPDDKPSQVLYSSLKPENPRGLGRRPSKSRESSYRKMQLPVPKQAPSILSSGGALIDELFAAIDLDEMERFDTLLKSIGSGINRKRGRSRRTLLHHAVANQRLPFIKELLSNPKCAGLLDLGDFRGRSALHEAVGRDNKEAARMLLRAGANVDALDDTGMTPLHLAVWQEKLGMAGMLVHRWAAEINTRDQYGDTPLHDACSNGSFKTVMFLLSCGADTDVKNFEGKRPQDVSPPDKVAIRQLFTQRLPLARRRHIPKVPKDPPQCNKNESPACQDFAVYVRHYCRRRGISRATSTSVHELVCNGAGMLGEIEDGFKDYLDKIKDRNLTPEDSAGDSDEKDVWKWIHFPANNMTWMKGLIYHMTQALQPDERARIWEFVERTIKERKGVAAGSCSRVPHAQDSRKEDRLGARESHIHGERPGSRASVSSERSNSLAVLTNRASYNYSQAFRFFPRDRKLSIVCPYVDFETEDYLDRKTQPDKAKRSQHVTKMTRFLDEFPAFSGTTGLQIPQTLDSSYYSMLEEDDLCVRDKDQVVLKWFKSRKEPEERSQLSATQDLEETELAPDPLPVKTAHERDTVSMKTVPKILMIHQLWMWKLDENTVITSCPGRWHAGVEDTLIDTIRQGGIESLHEPEDLIELMLFECATFLDEFRYAGVGDHILDIFDSTMALRADEEVRSFKFFREQIENREEGKAFNRDAVKSIAKEIGLIYEVKDIRDEVNLMRRVFEIQAEVIEKFARVFWPGTHDQAKQRRDDYLEACGTKALIKRTARLDEDASRTLQELDYLVQVKQAQSSLDESEAARSLNNFIMLFTIVTILFAPLSFMTSLFAVPIQTFPHNDDGEPRYSGLWMAGRLVAGEIATIAVIVIISAIIWNPNGVRYLRSGWKARQEFSVKNLFAQGLSKAREHPRRAETPVADPEDEYSKDAKSWPRRRRLWRSRNREQQESETHLA